MLYTDYENESEENAYLCINSDSAESRFSKPLAQSTSIKNELNKWCKSQRRGSLLIHGVTLATDAILFVFFLCNAEMGVFIHNATMFFVIATFGIMLWHINTTKKYERAMQSYYIPCDMESIRLYDEKIIGKDKIGYFTLNYQDITCVYTKRQKIYWGNSEAAFVFELLAFEDKNHHKYTFESFANAMELCYMIQAKSQNTP